MFPTLLTVKSGCIFQFLLERLHVKRSEMILFPVLSRKPVGKFPIANQAHCSHTLCMCSYTLVRRWSPGEYSCESLSTSLLQAPSLCNYTVLYLCSYIYLKKKKKTKQKKLFLCTVWDALSNHSNWSFSKSSGRLCLYDCDVSIFLQILNITASFDIRHLCHLDDSYKLSACVSALIWIKVAVKTRLLLL